MAGGEHFQGALEECSWKESALPTLPKWLCGCDGCDGCYEQGRWAGRVGSRVSLACLCLVLVLAGLLHSKS